MNPMIFNESALQRCTGNVTLLKRCRRMKHLLQLLIAGFTILGGVAGAQVSQAGQGLDSAVLADLRHKLPTEFPRVRSVVVLLHGRPTFEFYREGLDSLTLHDARFATASVVATLVGIALNEGLIKSTDQPLSDFLKEAVEEGVDTRVRTMKLENVLTLTAGFDPSVKQVGKWAFPTAFALRRPLVNEPGAAFSFNPGTAHLAARVVVGATKGSISGFAKKHLFGPLQIERYLWKIDGPGGNELGYAGLQLSALDMAKIGQLHLQDGVWNGKPLMPSKYVNAATRKQNNGGAPLGWKYGYLWWVAPFDAPSAFMAGADDGQRIYVDRTLDLVAVVTSDSPRVRGQKLADVDLVLKNFVLRSAKR